MAVGKTRQVKKILIAGNENALVSPAKFQLFGVGCTQQVGFLWNSYIRAPSNQTGGEGSVNAFIKMKPNWHPCRPQPPAVV